MLYLPEGITTHMNELYETKISNARWMVYDIPGNVGWIMYLVALVLSFVKQPTFMEVPLVLVCMAVAVLPAVAMLVGIAELINERYHKLDRVLTKKRLYRGFGALTWGGFAGTIASLTALFTSLRAGCSMNECRSLFLLAVGGALCFVFAGLLLKGYRRKAG